MSEPTNAPEPEETPEVSPAGDAAGAAEPEGEGQQPGPTIRDKRRIDPTTGRPRATRGDGSATQGDGSATQGDGSATQGDGSATQGDGSPEPMAAPTHAALDPVVGARLSELQELVQERTTDLQRLQAEYANYKKRVDRDRGLARIGGIEAVVLDLLPVLDSVEAAREHEELVGGFKLVADELEKISAKYGLEVFGEVGEVFDPQLHDALMHMPYAGEDEITETTISAVMQKGVKLNDRVLRPARVAVADPS